MNGDFNLGSKTVIPDPLDTITDTGRQISFEGIITLPIAV